MTCAKGAQEDGHTLPHTLRIASEARPGNLDPRYATDAYSQRIVRLLFASLVSAGPDGDFQPLLARSWRWDDPLTCTFDLSDGFAFSSGKPVSAEDVVATYASVLDEARASPRRATLDSVARVEALGPAAVRFHLEAPDAAFLEGALLGILPAAEAADPKVAPLALHGAGPYRLAHVGRDGGVELEKNPGYTRTPVPIPRLHFRVVPDGLTRALELKRASVDLVQSAIDPDTVAWLERTAPELAVLREPSSNFQYLGLNLRHPVLADPRVRRAIALALDRAAIVETVLNGQATVATGLLPPQHWAYPDEAPRLGHSPSKARALLDTAGWADPDGDGPQPRFVLSYKATSDDLSRRVGEAIAAQLAAVGIHLEVRSYDWGTFFADVERGNFHLYSLQWVGIADPDLLRRILHSSMTPPVGTNRAGFADLKIDRWTEKARRTTDRVQRRKLYARVERRVARVLPYVPLWWPERIVIANRRLHGFKPDPAGDLWGLLAASWAPPETTP